MQIFAEDWKWLDVCWLRLTQSAWRAEEGPDRTGLEVLRVGWCARWTGRRLWRSISRRPTPRWRCGAYILRSPALSRSYRRLQPRRRPAASLYQHAASMTNRSRGTHRCARLLCIVSCRAMVMSFKVISGLLSLCCDLWFWTPGLNTFCLYKWWINGWSPISL